MKTKSYKTGTIRLVPALHEEYLRLGGSRWLKSVLMHSRKQWIAEMGEAYKKEPNGMNFEKAKDGN